MLMKCTGSAEVCRVGHIMQHSRVQIFQKQPLGRKDWLYSGCALECLPCARRLAEVPECVSSLTSLQSLTLSHNAITALPQGVGRLAALQRLDVRCNKLRALPHALGEASSLQELDASGNSLEALPDSLGQLTSLRTLLLDNNKCGGFVL